MEYLRKHGLVGSPMRIMDTIVVIDPGDDDRAVTCTGVAENGVLHIIDIQKEQK
jgi:hypothetical protein